MLKNGGLRLTAEKFIDPYQGIENGRSDGEERRNTKGDTCRDNRRIDDWFIPRKLLARLVI